MIVSLTNEIPIDKKVIRMYLAAALDQNLFVLRTPREANLFAQLLTSLKNMKLDKIHLLRET